MHSKRCFLSRSRCLQRLTCKQSCLTTFWERNCRITRPLHTQFPLICIPYVQHVCLCVLAPCAHGFMLHLLECYFTLQPLMCPVREQQHGSLTCHTVAGHCVMIRECWRHSESSGVIKWCRGAAGLPQICLRLWHMLSQAYVYSLFILFCICFFTIFFFILPVWCIVFSCASLSGFSQIQRAPFCPCRIILMSVSVKTPLFCLFRVAFHSAFSSEFFVFFQNLLRWFVIFNNAAWKMTEGKNVVLIFFFQSVLGL